MQQLSIEAVNHDPDNEDIKTAAHIIAPTKVTVKNRDDIAHQSLKKSRAWVSQQRRDAPSEAARGDLCYLNQWEVSFV